MMRAKPITTNITHKSVADKLSITEAPYNRAILDKPKNHPKTIENKG